MMAAKLTPKQLAFIQALLSGQNITQAARSSGVSKRAAIYWMHELTPVRAEYQRQLTEINAAFHTRLAGLHDKALAALEATLEDTAQPALRFQAAKLIYEAHLADFGPHHDIAGPDLLVHDEIKGIYGTTVGRSNAVGLYDEKGTERLNDYTCQDRE